MAALAALQQSPMDILYLLNKTKPGHCLDCTKQITAEDLDHALCNTCWTQTFPSSVATAPAAPKKPKKRKVSFTDNAKKHDAQHPETIAFGWFFEIILMKGKTPRQAMQDEKIKPYAATLPAKVKQWIKEYDNLWEQFPDGIVDSTTQVSAYSLKLVDDTKRDYWVPKPKVFKLPVIKTSHTSCDLALRGVPEHNALLNPIRYWLKTIPKPNTFRPRPTPLKRKHKTVGTN